MKAIRSFYQRTNFPLLRTAVLLFFFLNAFTFPLFADKQENLTDALRKAFIDALRKAFINSKEVDIEYIDRLLDAGADPNGIYNIEYNDWTHETFLIRAAYDKKVQLVKVLLDHGADPNLATNGNSLWGSPPVFRGNKEITALFIAYGARFDVINNIKMSPLLEQAYENIASAILILEWEETHSPNFCGNYESRKDYLTAALVRLLNNTSDHHLRERDDTYTLAERLIDSGANPAAMHKDGFPVAYLAIKATSSDKQFLIPLFIEKGAPVDAYNEDGQTALYCAVYARNLELAELLLQKGADINQQNKSGWTALILTTSEKVMKFLLDHGADPNLQGGKGETALMGLGHKETAPIKLLLDHGADPNLQDKDGKTALMGHKGKTDIINLLMEYGADPTIKDNKGQTVLHYWISDLDGPMIDNLISRGCLIDEPDNEGVTPLISAIDRSRRVTLLLLEKGADPNYRGPKGRTALHVYLLDIEKQYRYKSENIERDQLVITALLEAGTRPADKDDDGDSALITALRIAQKDKNATPLTDLVQRYADAEEIKIATDAARKMISTEKREYRREELSVNILPTIKALSFPIIWGGASFLMRNEVFKNYPSSNIMGTVNGMFTLGGCGVFLGAVMGASFGDMVGMIVGGIIGGVAGIIVACLPSVSKAFTNNPALYYTPTAVSALVSSVVILKIWF